MKRRPPKNGEREIRKKNALLIDGNALLKLGYHGAKKEYNHFGEHIGGLYVFLNVLRKLLDKGIYHNVFVFWDGPLSGKLRYEHYKDYKGNRDKNFETGTFSQDKDLVRQKLLICNYLEDLSIRQLEDYVVEADDFIAYFCKTKKEEYNITICTTDRDMAQLICESVQIYFADLKKIVTLENYQETFLHHQSNALLVKIIAGDNSDNIKGIKGVKEDTLVKYFPDITTRKLQFTEFMEMAKEIEKKREEEKKPQLKAIHNIIHGISDGCQGERFYEINKLIMNLKSPLMTESAKEKFDDITTLPIDPEGRSIKNIYGKMKSDGLDRLINEHMFADYMLPFKKIINKEKENYNLWVDSNEE